MSNESVICKLANEIDKIIDRLDKLEKDGERQDRLTEALRSNCVSFGKKFYDLESSQPKESNEMPEIKPGYFVVSNMFMGSGAVADVDAFDVYTWNGGDCINRAPKKNVQSIKDNEGLLIWKK